MTNWLHCNVTLYLFLDVWGIKHHYFSSRLVFAPRRFFGTSLENTHSGQTHTQALSILASPSLTSPCQCVVNDWDPNNTQTPCRLVLSDCGKNNGDEWVTVPVITSPTLRWSELCVQKQPLRYMHLQLCYHHAITVSLHIFVALTYEQKWCECQALRCECGQSNSFDVMRWQARAEWPFDRHSLQSSHQRRSWASQSQPRARRCIRLSPACSCCCPSEGASKEDRKKGKKEQEWMVRPRQGVICLVL